MGSALRELELRYDGPIPAELRRAAMAADFAASLAAPRIARVRLRVKAWKPEGAIARMAEVIRDRLRGGGRCYRSDLAAAGFSRLEIDLYAEDARAFAARRAEAAGEALEPRWIPVTELLAAAARRIA